MTVSLIVIVELVACDNVNDLTFVLGCLVIVRRNMCICKDFS